jgi:uncharacterized protein YcfJ
MDEQWYVENIASMDEEEHSPNIIVSMDEQWYVENIVSMWGLVGVLVGALVGELVGALVGEDVGALVGELVGGEEEWYAGDEIAPDPTSRRACRTVVDRDPESCLSHARRLCKAIFS